MERVRRISLADAGREERGFRSGPRGIHPEPRNTQRALVWAARNGDIDAFTRLFERYRNPLYQACLRRLRNPALAEDAVQETFLKAYDNLAKFDAGRRIWPWLVTIADHTCIDVLRRQARLSSIEEVDDSEPIPGPAGRHQADDTFDAVVGAEKRARLEEALATLPPRQRRALLLFALEGWSYPEIASAEGISHVAIKSVIWRARTTIRKVCEVGALNVLVLPYHALRRRLARARGSIYQVRADGLALGGVNSLSVGVLAFALTFGGGFSDTTPSLSTAASAMADVSVTPSRVSPASISAKQKREISPGEQKPSDGNEISLDELGKELQQDLLDPTRDAEPENTQFSSIVVSPHYRNDRTVYATGAVPCVQTTCPVLFRSRDGGGTWTKLAAEDFTGHTLYLPPNYPQDSRIFAMGPAALQESIDGGQSFRTVSPLSGGVAISPAFGNGDPRVLIGSATIMEYLADDRHVTKPAALAVSTFGDAQIAFSPAYRPSGAAGALTDGVILVGTSRPNTSPLYQSTVYRCEGSVCASTALPGGFGTPKLRLSSGFARDGRIYAFTNRELFVSKDGGRNFLSLSLPRGVNSLTEVVLPPADSSLPPETVFAAGRLSTDAAPGGLYRSDDGGESWTALPIDLKGFNYGARWMALTPTGRIVAAGTQLGLACSSDGGMSWSTRCSFE